MLRFLLLEFLFGLAAAMVVGWMGWFSVFQYAVYSSWAWNSPSLPPRGILCGCGIILLLIFS
jgi:hypothetical protein